MAKESGLELVAFVGVIGSGKDYQSQLLVKQGYTHINFADSLRELAWIIMNWKPLAPIEYEAYKKTDWLINFPVSVKGELQHDHPNPEIMSGRQFLQRLGDGVRQVIGEESWINAFRVKLRKLIAEGHTKFCVSDLRYANEFNAIKTLNTSLSLISPRMDIKIIFTDFRSDKYNDNDPHISEKLAQQFLAAKSHKDLDIIWETPN